MIIYIARSLWLHSLCTWYQKYLYLKLGVVVHVYNPGTWLEEAGKIRSSRPILMKNQVWVQPRLYETLLQKKWNKAKWSQTLVFGLGGVTLGGKALVLYTQNLEFGSSALQKQQTHLSGTENVQTLFLSTSHKLPSVIWPNHGSSALFPLYCWTNRLRQVSQHVGPQQLSGRAGAWLKAG